MPYQKSEVAKTGNIEKKYRINLGKYSINLLNSSTNFEKYDTINNANKLTLFGIYELPIELETITYEEFTSNDVIYSKKEALELAKEGAYSKAKEKVPEGANILDCTYKVFTSKDEVIVRATIECLERVGVESKF